MFDFLTDLLFTHAELAYDGFGNPYCPVCTNDIDTAVYGNLSFHCPHCGTILSHTILNPVLNPDK